MLHAPLLFSQQHNGAAEAFQYFLFILRYMAKLLCTFRIPAHDGKGFFIPLLSPAKLSYRGFLIHPAGQMYAAQTLDGNYAAFGEVVEGMEILDQVMLDIGKTGQNGEVDTAKQPIIATIKMVE
jgi:cyclophilin family peptidyl-prolyl cis-trans isomerase